MKFRFNSIITRVFALFVPAIVLMFLSFTVVNYRAVSSASSANFDDRMLVSLQAAELKMQLELYKNEAVALNLANHAKSLERESFDHEKNKKKLAEYIGMNGNTIGGGVWFEPYKFYGDSYNFGVYLFYDADGNYSYIPNYDRLVNYFNEDWYLKGKASKGGTVWSTAYYDPYSGVNMVTASRPFFDADGRFAGMGTADMDISSIRRIVDGTAVGETGHTFIIGARGEYIASLDKNRGVFRAIQDDEDEALAQLGREMLENREGKTTLKRKGAKYRVYYSTIDSVNWTMATIVDEREIHSSALSAFLYATIIPVAGLLLIIVGIYAFVAYLRRIIGKVNSVADMAASGDFSKRVDVTESDEFGFMEQRLNKMIMSLDDMNRRSSELLSATEEANRSKSEFLSRMSHEIRSPMNAIIGMTQIAKNTGDPKRIRDCLAKIDNASKHLLALINDVLDMSKIEANKLELVSEEFSLEEALNKVYDMMSVKAEEKQQFLKLSVDKNIPARVVGDELRFSQVVTNLVSNAVKFTGEFGKIEIYVTEIDNNGNTHTIMVDVKDSGIGLSPEQMPKLFEPFEQVDGNITRKFGGSGLGLAINKRIVEMMGGKIRVESALGEGSVFSFTVKMGSVSAAAAAAGCAAGCAEAASAGAADSAEKQAQLKPMRTVQASDMRILVADDSEESGDYMLHTLRALGFKCDLARSGGKAVDMVARALLENHSYDVIFMDYMMPGINGLEAAKKIYEITDRNISIVMISIYNWRDFEIRARKAGVSKCVSKPVSPSTMIDAISETVPYTVKIHSAAAAPHAEDLGGNTVLVAEDIEINREIVTAYLEDTKLNIEFAVNGWEAVDKFRENPDRYDLIFMDIQMPGMDGYEATRQIRALDTKKAKTVPIVAMTANALSEDVRRCKEAGMNDHIAKPIDPETLLLKLNDYFFMKRYLGRDIW